MNSVPTIDAVFFDYGGVLAEEGYLEGLKTIARRNGLDPEAFFQTAVETIYDMEYLTGKATEAQYFELLRERTGFKETLEEIHGEILPRFQLRPWMITIVNRLKDDGRKVAILSDQTSWLNDLEQRDDFFRHFHKVFNSYYTGYHKREKASFEHAAGELDVAPECSLFIDDAARNVMLARETGMHAVHYNGKEQFLQELTGYFPQIRVDDL